MLRIVFILFLTIQAILWYGAGIRVVGKLSPRVFFGTMRGIVTAATFFWSAIFLLSLVFGPVYCGWVCAFGSYQDAVYGLLRGRRRRGSCRSRGGGISRGGTARPAGCARCAQYARYGKYVLLAFLLGGAS